MLQLALLFLVVSVLYILAQHSEANLSFQSFYQTASSSDSPSKAFTIKHIYHHGTGEYETVHRRLDITPEFIENYQLRSSGFGIASLPKSLIDSNPWNAKLGLKSQKSQIRRMTQRDPDFIESYLEYIHSDPANANKIHLDWFDEDVHIPNVTDKDTIVALALMLSNAYVEEPGTGDWIDVGEPWHNKSSYGWADSGLRGHVFTNEDDSIVVISIKGTSAAYISKLDASGQRISDALEDDVFIEGKPDTVENDKINDNLLFSCCCARVLYLWTTVCDCYRSSYTCDQRCLEKELRRRDRYYQGVLDLYRNVSLEYPNSEIWLTGHSLGGSLALLLGRTYGLPAVTFQAPGELMATQRLHLPVPPGLPSELEHIWHFGNTGDPIFMGVCNGASSACSLAGYALESACHTGKTCVYDTVTDLGWSVSLYNHRIHAVIDNVILYYNETAACKQPVACKDCFNWEYVSDDLNDKYKSTTSSQSTTTTSSSTSSTAKSCKRYNWWGKCVEWDDEAVPTAA